MRKCATRGTTNLRNKLYFLVTNLSIRVMKYLQNPTTNPTYRFGQVAVHSRLRAQSLLVHPHIRRNLNPIRHIPPNKILNNNLRNPSPIQIPLREESEKGVERLPQRWACASPPPSPTPGSAWWPRARHTPAFGSGPSTPNPNPTALNASLHHVECDNHRLVTAD